MTTKRGAQGDKYILAVSQEVQGEGPSGAPLPLEAVGGAVLASSAAGEHWRWGGRGQRLSVQQRCGLGCRRELGAGQWCGPPGAGPASNPSRPEGHSVAGGPPLPRGLICQAPPRTAERPCPWGASASVVNDRRSPAVNLSLGDCGPQAGPPGEKGQGVRTPWEGTGFIQMTQPLAKQRNHKPQIVCGGEGYLHQKLLWCIV